MNFVLALITVTTTYATEPVCGFYQVEDFGDRVLYSVTQFTNQKNYRGQTIFTITNPASPQVKNLLRGMCYCLTGEIQEDPEFIGDEAYRLITVEQVESMPYTGCVPAQR